MTELLKQHSSIVSEIVTTIDTVYTKIKSKM